MIAAASCPMHKALVINFFPGFLPPSTGGEQRHVNTVLQIAEAFRTDVITPTFPKRRDETVELGPNAIEHRFSKTELYQHWHEELKRLGVGNSVYAMGCSLAAPRHRTLMACYRRLASSADIIIFESPYMFSMDRHSIAPETPRVYLSHNCEFLLAGNGNPNGPGQRLAGQLYLLERSLVSRSRLVLGCTEDDLAAFRTLYQASEDKLALLPNGCLNQPDLRRDEPTGATVAVFAGSNFAPNVDGAMFIINELAAAVPEVDFTIVGSVRDGLGQVITGPNVRILGRVDDERYGQVMSEASIALNPVISGSGSNLKLADYMARGCAVVSTPFGARGYAVESGHDIVLADRSEFVSALKAMVAEPGRRRQIQANARTTAERRYSWEALCKPAIERMRAVVETARPRGATGRRLLCVNEFPVRGHANGGQARIAGLYSELPKNMEATLLTQGRRDPWAARRLGNTLGAIEAPCNDLENELRRRVNQGSYAGASDYVGALAVLTNEPYRYLFERLAAHSDVVVMEHPYHAALLLLTQTRVPLLLDAHNVEQTLKLRAMSTHRDYLSIVETVAALEDYAAQVCDRIIACSPADKGYFKGRFSKPVDLVPNGTGVPPKWSPLRAADLGELRARMETQEEPRSVYHIDELVSLEGGELFVDRVHALFGLEPLEGLERARALEMAETSKGRRRMVARVRDDERAARAYVLVLGLESTRPTCVFLGSAHRPNVAAALYLARVVAPQLDHTDFLIVGGVCYSVGLAALPGNVKLLGHVSDIDKEIILQVADVGANPMLWGGGSSLKVPDSLRCGLPLVSTHVGGRCFDYTEAQGLAKCDLWEFPERVRQIVELGGAEKARLRKAAQATAATLSWEKLGCGVAQSVAAVLDRPAGRPRVLVLGASARRLSSGERGHFEEVAAAVAATMPAAAWCVWPFEAAYEPSPALSPVLDEARLSFQEMRIFCADPEASQWPRRSAPPPNVPPVEPGVWPVDDAGSMAYFPEQPPKLACLLSGWGGHDVVAARKGNGGAMVGRRLGQRAFFHLPVASNEVTLEGFAEWKTELSLNGAVATCAGEFHIVFKGAFFGRICVTVRSVAGNCELHCDEPTSILLCSIRYRPSGLTHTDPVTLATPIELGLVARQRIVAQTSVSSTSELQCCAEPSSRELLDHAKRVDLSSHTVLICDSWPGDTIALAQLARAQGAAYAAVLSSSTPDDRFLRSDWRDALCGAEVVVAFNEADAVAAEAAGCQVRRASGSFADCAELVLPENTRERDAHRPDHKHKGERFCMVVADPEVASNNRWLWPFMASVGAMADVVPIVVALLGQPTWRDDDLDGLGLHIVRCERWDQVVALIQDAVALVDLCGHRRRADHLQHAMLSSTPIVGLKGDSLLTGWIRGRVTGFLAAGPVEASRFVRQLSIDSETGSAAREDGATGALVGLSERTVYWDVARIIGECVDGTDTAPQENSAAEVSLEDDDDREGMRAEPVATVGGETQ